MARVTLAEYRDSYKDSSGVVFPFPSEPPMEPIQAAKTSLGTSQSWTLKSAARWVRVSTDTAIHYRVAKTATAATQDDNMIPAGVTVDIPVGKEGRFLAVLAQS
jgi:P pilus assembly chaperone PapD